ncbi:MAG: NAD(P)/FAD-dependent oxidoreductase [Mangrovicoccus sp.]
MTHIIVVGAGQAGSSLTAKLRGLGFEGQITLIGDEPQPPYQRPPLSKAYLLGEMTEERLYLRPESFYADQNITLRTGVQVTAIDRSAQQIQLSSGESLSYDHLALTTGAIVRDLPESCNGNLDGVYPVRTLAHIDLLEPAMQPGKHALILGGGYIGLEAAAVAVKRGMTATLVQSAPRLLRRVACPETSDYFHRLHESHGVELILGQRVQHLTGEGHVTGALLEDGREIQADLVIIGIGIDPATELAETAGLQLDNGIAVDEYGRSSDPAIWSAGDCASFPYRGDRIRLESVQNAIDQAENIAENMMGAEKPYQPQPWFWSDQYDIKLQIAGLNTGYDRVVVRETEDGAHSHWYYRGDQLLAVDAMNAPREFMVAKRLLAAGKSPDPALVADGSVAAKALLG